LSSASPSCSGGISLQSGGRTYRILHGRHGRFPAGYVTVEPAMAEWAVRRWFREGCLDRQRQCALYWTMHPMDRDLSRFGQGELAAWVAARIAAGGFRIAYEREVRVGEDIHAFALEMGIDLGRKIAPPPKSTGTVEQYATDRGQGPVVPLTAFPGTGELAGWVDETGPACPAPNWRSESAETASPEVRDWLQQNLGPRFDAKGRDQWNSTLGAEGGGGFVKGSTRVITLRKGQPLYRSFSTAGRVSPDGGWWFLDLYDGDPRAVGALPQGSSAEKLVCAEVVTDDATVLYGLGAPRCSNKPGGPPQICMSQDQCKQHRPDPAIALT
jgi:hypothetical protein